VTFKSRSNEKPKLGRTHVGSFAETLDIIGNLDESITSDKTDMHGPLGDSSGNYIWQ
jgi:hypothetical protein